MQPQIASQAITTKSVQQCQTSILTFPFDRHQNLSQKFDYDIDLYNHSHPDRSDIETFIEQGFNQAYGADVSVTMPLLLAIKKGAFKAALGLRSATMPLFVEQYLNMPIEKALSHKTAKARRDQIVEVGHLYSNHTKFALPLLLTTGVSLFVVGQQTLVFCATNHVKKLIADAGIPLTELCKAYKEKLTDKVENWGSYYQTSPSVIAISTSDIIQAVISSELYLQLFNVLTSRVQSVSTQLLEEMK